MTESKTTMADVARRAGVSASTAARVISGKGYVSDENRKRVEAAVAAIGYRPNVQARALRYSRSFSLGLILSAARLNPIFTNISHAIRQTAAARGYSLLTVNHGYDAGAEEIGVGQFIEHGVEAVFLCHAFSARNIARLEQAGIPLIEIERRSVPGAALVRIDPLPGMRDAVAHLAAQGHRRIAFIGATRESLLEVGTSGDEEPARVTAFQQAAAEAGLAVADLVIALGHYSYPSGQLAQSGRDLAARVLDGGGPLPTAIISGSDVLTAGILQELYARQVRVPDQISVVSYDDSISALLTPACATIAQPYAAIGLAALDLVGVNSASDSRVREVATSFIARSSTGPAPT